MKKNITIIVALFFFLTITVSLAEAQQPASQDDNISLESFTTLLKDEWTYLRDAIDQLNKEIEKRGEFETTPEFQARAARTRQNFLDKLNGHIKDIKLEQRVFGILFKATLASYDADAGVYSLKCATTIEAPYDIPNVESVIPDNSYIETADSIQGGYRTSSIRMKLNPDFKWKITRNEAMTAKGNEASIFFKIHFIINMKQENFSTQAQLKIIPKDISLINQANNYIYWKEAIK